MPKVFISYSQDSDAHKARVLAFSEALRGDGIDTVLDQYHAHEILHWPDWCRKQLKSADFVICLCTEGYRRRVDAEVQEDEGRGVHWEARIILNEFYQHKGNGRVLVVLLNDKSDACIPDFMGGWTRCCLFEFKLSDAGYESLYRIITVQPVVVPGKLGEIKKLGVHAKPESADPISAVKDKSCIDITNPFDPWTPVTPPAFVGRKVLLRSLGQAMDQKRSVSLVGDWKIGKSSVLKAWEIEVKARGRKAVLLSGENAEAVSCAAFVQAVTGRLVNDDTPDKAADVLAAWAALEPLPPVVLVDKSDAIFAQLPYRFFERMRGMLGQLVLVIASRRTIDDIYRDFKSTSPFLNRLELQWLGLLEPDAAQKIIERGAGVLCAEDIGCIRHWAGNHPYFLALIAHDLWNARAYDESVESAMDHFRMEADQRLNDLWKILTVNEQTALHGLLHGRTTDMRALRQRGLTDNGKAFGEILLAWMAESL